MSVAAPATEFVYLPEQTRQPTKQVQAAGDIKQYRLGCLQADYGGEAQHQFSYLLQTHAFPLFLARKGAQLRADAESR